MCVKKVDILKPEDSVDEAELISLYVTHTGNELPMEITSFVKELMKNFYVVPKESRTTWLLD